MHLYLLSFVNTEKTQVVRYSQYRGSWKKGAHMFIKLIIFDTATAIYRGN